jgi:hypothetical protein
MTMDPEEIPTRRGLPTIAARTPSSVPQGGGGVLIAEAVAALIIITVTDLRTTKQMPAPGTFFAVGLIYIGAAMVSGGNRKTMATIGAIPVVWLLITRGVAFFNTVGSVKSIRFPVPTASTSTGTTTTTTPAKTTAKGG